MLSNPNPLVVREAQLAHSLGNDAWPLYQNVVTIPKLATVTGTGTNLANSFAGGWENTINGLTADNWLIDFPPGHYTFSNTIAPTINGIHLRGGPGVRLHYTGTGRAFSFDGRAFGGDGYFFHNITMEGFNIDGGTNQSMTKGLYYDSIFD